VAVKRDDMPYGSAGPAPGWEARRRYDELMRLAEESINGVAVARFARTPAGSVYAISAAGIQPTYTTYDLLGNPVWSRDASGTELIWTRRVTPWQTGTGVLKGRNTANARTMATLQEFDARGFPFRETRFAGAIRVAVDWSRDALGFIVSESGPDGSVTAFDRNWLGWPRRVSVQRDLGAVPAFDTASFEYNRCGQVTAVVDPANQRSEFDYDGFGSTRARRTPGQPRVNAAFTYDALGRLSTLQIGAVQIRAEYDGKHDSVGESVFDQGAWQPVTRRGYDDLGRLVYAWNVNYVLGWLPASDRTVRQDFAYDPLGQMRQQITTIGRRPPQTIRWDWSLNAAHWQCRTARSHRAGWTEWMQSFDGAGRLAQMARLAGGRPGAAIAFRWTGDLYQGRVQEQADCHPHHIHALTGIGHVILP
jgi:YD repeat-containing protein